MKSFHNPNHVDPRDQAPADPDPADPDPADTDPTDDDMRFDRLVDGELSDVERRRMLASLDDEPGGWRRCALAFLEVQAWRQGMQAADHPGETPPAATASQSLRSAKSTRHPDSHGNRRADGATIRPGFAGLVLAMAACFLVAFFLGTEFRQRTLQGPQAPPPVAQRQTPAAVESSVADVPRDNQDRSPPNPIIPWGEATFVIDGDEAHEIDVPVFDLDPDARQVVLENSRAALDNLRHRLQQRGYEVRRDVHLSPIEMGGGQQMFVPIGDFEITPIARRAIQ